MRPKQTKNNVEQTIIYRFAHYALADWIQSFLLDKKASSKSINTIQYYQGELYRFAAFLETNQIIEVTQITTHIIRHYMVELEQNRGYKPGGMHASYRAIRAWLNWFMVEEEPAGWPNPITKVKAPKLDRHAIRPIQPTAMRSLLDHCHTTIHPERNNAILLCLLDTGARSDELLAIDLLDIDLVQGTILIRKGKGGKGRLVFIGAKTRKAIRAYLRTRTDAYPYLWVNRDGERLKYSGLKMMLQRLCKLAKVDPIMPHDFRRTFALEMLRNGTDLITLSRLMGHADISILQRYISQSNDDLIEAHRKASPADTWKL